ncbi:MAG: glycoside hydrolase family 43 C-terminal domain-containing protein [Pseudomonadota bacterium]
MKLRHLTPLSLALFTLGGCAISPPERSPYGGTDNVDTVSADSLVGTWNISVLNPIEGEENTSATITLNADGTTTGTSRGVAGGQEMVIEMNGTWSVDGEYLVTTMESTAETSGSAIAKLAQELVSNMMKNRKARGDVFELSANRVVIVDSETRQAQQWTR